MRRRKRHKVKASLRIGMTGVGLLLIFLLFGNVMSGINWQVTGKEVIQEVKEQASVWAAFVWRQNYPMMRPETKKTQKIPWYLEFVWDQVPLYRYLISHSDQRQRYEEADPSYQSFLENKEFYREHQYLFQYGIEDTNQQVADPENPPIEEPLVDYTQTTTPAHTIRSDRAIIGTNYVKEQLADYDFLMKHFYNVHSSTTADRDLMSSDRLLSVDLSLESTAEKPQILIYHTHSQETYADFGQKPPEGTVVGVGNYLTELLQQKGYHVIHDTSVYDLQGEKLDRNKAYSYALEGITEILQNNPSIEVILDLHRDGVKEGLHMVNEVNGKPTAPIMFFNGLSQTPEGSIEYLPNPYREENLAFSLQMQLDAAAYYPGLTRKIYLKGLRYNLHLRPRSALIEVGAQTNTYEEARNAMEPLAELLDMVLQGD